MRRFDSSEVIARLPHARPHVLTECSGGGYFQPTSINGYGQLGYAADGSPNFFVCVGCRPGSVAAQDYTGGEPYTTHECNEGYRNSSKLCSVCEDGYARLANKKCRKCSFGVGSFVYFAFPFFVVLTWFPVSSA